MSWPEAFTIVMCVACMCAMGVCAWSLLELGRFPWETTALVAFGESLKKYRNAVRSTLRGKASNADKYGIERFLVTARHALSDYEYRWFRLHYVIGGDLKLCAAQFGINYTKANQLDFRVREKVGKAMMATKEAPHA